ncbi:MAG: CsgG/HfaB family protein [Cyanobacteria bacterium J06639_14]
MQFLSRFLTVSGLTLAALVTTTLSAVTAAGPATLAETERIDDINLAQFQDARPRITVLPLSHGDVSSDYWWWYNYDQGQGAARGITELLVNELVNDGSYSLLDSSQFSSADDEGTALEMAEENDLDAVLIGTITQFDLQDSAQCANVPFVGTVCNNETKAIVQLNVRLVDPISKTVIATAQGEGDAVSASFGVSLNRAPDINSEEQRVTDELLSDATERAIEQLMPEIVAAQDSF